MGRCALCAQIAAGDEAGPDPDRVALLTRRERDAWLTLPVSRDAEDLARRLAIAISTGKTHLRSVYAKLGALGWRDASAMAVEWHDRTCGPPRDHP